MDDSQDDTVDPASTSSSVVSDKPINYEDPSTSTSVESSNRPGRLRHRPRIVLSSVARRRSYPLGAISGESCASIQLTHIPSWLKVCLKLWQEVIRCNFSSDFRYNKDYSHHPIIFGQSEPQNRTPQPMDLRTIGTKLEGARALCMMAFRRVHRRNPPFQYRTNEQQMIAEAYISAKEFLDDLNLLISYSRIYNNTRNTDLFNEWICTVAVPRLRNVMPLPAKDSPPYSPVGSCTPSSRHKPRRISVKRRKARYMQMRHEQDELLRLRKVPSNSDDSPTMYSTSPPFDGSDCFEDLCRFDLETRIISHFHTSLGRITITTSSSSPSEAGDMDNTIKDTKFYLPEDKCQ